MVATVQPETISVDSRSRSARIPGLVLVGSFLGVFGTVLAGNALETEAPEGGSVLLKILPSLQAPDADPDQDGVVNANDCSNFDPQAWRFVVTYTDVDGDGVGSGRGELSCMGARAPSGQSMLGYFPIDTLRNPESESVSDSELPVYILIAIDSDGDNKIR